MNPRPGAPARRRPARRGFTYIELVVVVLVLGVLAGAAAPVYRAAMADAQLESAARRLAGEIRRCRSRAIATGAVCRIDFDTAAVAYSSAQLDSVDRPEQRLAVSLRDAGYAIRMPVASFGGAPSVAFDHRGDPAAAGSVELWLGSDSYAITVSQAGRVDLSND